MDQIKIGKFIAKLRKENKLTQKELADRLNITDRAISKWETGRSLPDSSVMLDLCGELKISVNELLSGEVIRINDYNKIAEQKLLELTKEKEEADKRLLAMEIAIGVLLLIPFLSLTFVAAYMDMSDTLRIILIIIGIVPFIIGALFAIRIEQVAGYYECRKCHHRYVPTYNSVLWAMHICRTRYMKCPSCGKFSWQKKKISK